MNDREKEEYMNAIQEMQSENQALRTAKNYSDSQSTQLSSYYNEVKANMVELQINLEKEKNRIFHILAGNELVKTADGEFYQKSVDDELIILSDYGIKRVMQKIEFYLGKHITLSYFKTIEEINQRVHTFGIELTDEVYGSYEDYFHFPSIEELFDQYKEIREEEYERPLKQEEEIELHKLCEIESGEQLKKKFKVFNSLIFELCHTIEANYRRALNGRTFLTLNKNINVHQNIGEDEIQARPEKRGWFRR